jgi:CRP-like cAMP-binding protein
MSQAVTPETIKTLAFFSPATEVELGLLVPVARFVEYPTGTVVFHAGAELSDVFIVTAGTVVLEVTGPDHRPRRFQTVTAGELLGWSPLLGGGPMTATARALTDVRAIALDAMGVLDACERDPGFGYLFMRRTAAAIAARLGGTRLQLLDVYKHELPAPAPEGGES